MNDLVTSRQAPRRDFIKVAAGALSAAAFSGYAAGSDTIRGGGIGCGGRGGAAAMNADKGIRIVAMADIRLDRVQGKRAALKLKYPEQVAVDDDHCFKGFDGYKNVIESSDVVIIANAAKFHPLHLKAAVAAGKHVFVEKPHAIDPYGINMVRSACEMAASKGLSVMSGLQ